MARDVWFDVYAQTKAGTEVPLARGALVQPWLLLLSLPLDELLEWALSIEGPARVDVAIDGRRIQGTLLLADPLDQGVIAAVELDEDMLVPFDPLVLPKGHDLALALSSVYARITEAPGEAGFGTSPGSTDPYSPRDLGEGIDLGDGTTWPDLPPAAWPPTRHWPPIGDGPSLRWVCYLLPCCRGCPPNSRCTVPEPPSDPAEPW